MDINADRVVKLVIEARQTHGFVVKIHNTVLLLWLLFGVFHYHSSFEERWHGLCLGVLQAYSVFQSVWGVILILLVALRNGTNSLFPP